MTLHALQTALRYAWNADTIYDVHAPKAFSFLGEVIEDRRHFYAYDLIEAIREQYRLNNQEVKLFDAGAGSKIHQANSRSVAEIVNTSASPPRFGRYLLCMADWLQARHILELGTNLGIGTCYLAAGMATGGRMVSIDADPGLAAFAKTAAERLAPRAQLDIRVGTFDEQLPSALRDLGRIDLAFIDGHHEEEATKRYFSAIMSYCHNRSFVILDDIHWSPGMERAWEWVKQQPQVRLSFDLYRWGVVGFDESLLVPQHFTIVPWQWKFWHMGFFDKSERG